MHETNLSISAPARHFQEIVQIHPSHPSIQSLAIDDVHGSSNHPLQLLLISSIQNILISHTISHISPPAPRKERKNPKWEDQPTRISLTLFSASYQSTTFCLEEPLLCYWKVHFILHNHHLTPPLSLNLSLTLSLLSSIIHFIKSVVLYTRKAKGYPFNTISAVT